MKDAVYALGTYCILVKTGHRLQQELRDESSLFSPFEFAESVNWICCFLFCFRWKLSHGKCILFLLRVWTTLSPVSYHGFWNSHNTVGQPYLVRYLLLHDCSTYIVLCYKIRMPQGLILDWLVSVSSAVLCCLKEMPSDWKWAAGKPAWTGSLPELLLVCAGCTELVP